MPKEEFWEIMEKGRFVKPRLHRAWLAFLYYVGCRKTEALLLTPKSFEIQGEELLVDVPPLKHGIERDVFRLDLNLPYVDVIVEQLQKTRKGRRVWPFDETTGWRIVKRAAGEKYYPHFFRLNRCVKFLNNKDLTLNEVRQWFAWKSLKTVDSYLGYSDRTMKKLSRTLE